MARRQKDSLREITDDERRLADPDCSSTSEAGHSCRPRQAIATPSLMDHLLFASRHLVRDENPVMPLPYWSASQGSGSVGDCPQAWRWAEADLRVAARERILAEARRVPDPNKTAPLLGH